MSEQRSAMTRGKQGRHERTVPARAVRCLVFCVCLVVSAQSLAWGAQRYTRKAVAAASSVAVTDPSIKLSPEQRALLTEALENGLMLPRFDKAVLPQSIQNRLDSQINNRTVSEAELQSIVDQTVVPAFVKILQSTLEERALRDTPDFDRHSFINTKAKEIGITAEDLERMMQCAYLYVPYVSKTNVVGSGDAAQAEIGGGLDWYHLALDGSEGPRVEKVARVKAGARTGAGSWANYAEKNVDAMSKTADSMLSVGKALGLGGKTKDSPAAAVDKDGGASNDALAPDLQAFRNAANLLAINLASKTCELDWARVMAPVADVDGSSLLFNLGKKEGLKVDDRFEIIEQYEDARGRVFRERIGHCMVRSVVDNRSAADARSRAKMIIGGGDAMKGMEMQEVSRMGIDLSIRPAWYTLDMNSLSPQSGFTLTRATANGAYGSDVSLEMNFGRRVGVSQLFLTIGGGYAYVPVDAEFAVGASPEEVSRADLAGIHLGLMKRQYVGRFALRLGAEYGWSRLSLRKRTDGDLKYTLSEDFTPLRANLGFEMALSTNSNFGLYGGYQWRVGSDNWNLAIGDRETHISKSAFDVDYQGIYGGLAITYALPSLGWKPF
jgi:hypothetical protein